MNNDADLFTSGKRINLGVISAIGNIRQYCTMKSISFDSDTLFEVFVNYVWKLINLGGSMFMFNIDRRIRLNNLTTFAGRRVMLYLVLNFMEHIHNLSNINLQFIIPLSLHHLPLDK